MSNNENNYINISNIELEKDDGHEPCRMRRNSRGTGRSR